MGDLTSGPGRKIMTAVCAFSSRTVLMKGRVSVQSLLKQVMIRGKFWLRSEVDGFLGLVGGGNLMAGCR